MTIGPNVFVPKQRDKALFLIKHELYHRLAKLQNARQAWLIGSVAGTLISDEIEFLQNLIDCIERS